MGCASDKDNGRNKVEVNEKGEEVGEKAKDFPNYIDVEFDPPPPPFVIARLRGVVERTIQQIKNWPFFFITQTPCCSNEMRTYKMILFSVLYSCELVSFE